MIAVHVEKKISLSIFRGTGNLFPVIRNVYLKYS